MNKKILILIIVIGGLLVLGSYAFIFLTYPGNVSDFWGSFPEKYLPPYYLSMVLSALSYFVFTLFVLLKVDVEKMNFGKSFSYSIFSVLYLLILIPSAAWMPIVNLYLNNNSTLLWFLIRFVLTVVGLASLILTIVLIQMKPRQKGIFYIASILTSAYFFFHTGILDALVWTQYFHR